MRKANVSINEETGVKVEEIYNDQNLSKSAKMKKMFDLGLDVKEIAEVMEVRYNFVYNVVSNYVNIEEIPVVKEPGESKKGQIIEMFLAGKTNKEIAKTLKLNYNYIYKVVREYGETLRAPKAEVQQQAVGGSTPTVPPTPAPVSIPQEATGIVTDTTPTQLPPQTQQVRKKWGFLPTRS